VSDRGFLYALHSPISIVTITLSPTIRLQFAIECCRRSNQQGQGHFGAKFGVEGVEGCKPNFNAIWERSISSAVSSQCKNVRDWYTDKRTKGIVTLISLGKIAFSNVA